MSRVVAPRSGTGRAMASTSVKHGLELYLRQIDEAPLLTPEQEKELCWRIMHENCPRSEERRVGKEC